MASASKKRKVIHGEARQTIASIYHFLKQEYEFTDLYKEPNCDLSHLRNITKRTAEAAGVSERTVQQILKEERDAKKEKADDDISSKLTPKDREKTANEIREIIANVYHFLKKEYEYTDLNKPPNCDMSHLGNVTKRTAEATGVSERTVEQILEEKVEGGTSSKLSLPVKTRKKKNKLAAQHQEQKLKQRESFDAPGPSSAAVAEDDSDSEESCNTEVAVRVITEPLTDIQDPLANIYNNNQCRFCANITKNCTDATDKPYIENNKMILTLNNLNLEIDFNINTRKVCLDCDRKILDMINFVKQVKDAQECLNVSYDMELTETYVKMERESTPDDDDDDEDTKDEIVDSITIDQTAFVKSNAFAHKKRKCVEDKPSSKQKKAKDSKVTHENTEFIINIKKERIDDEDVIKGNLHKDTYSEDTHERKEDTGHDIKPSKLDVAFNSLPMSDEMKGDGFS